jgi:TonB-linked SusC/RagA family outer membrane protein
LGFLTVPISVFAQSFEISGTVTSENKEPLYGAIVQIKNGKASATTNDSGKFTITVQNIGDILQISYVGLTTQEISIKNENELAITLNNANSLNDVVVIGYGSQKKSVSTGAISSVKAADLDNQVNSRIDNALQGRTSGVSVAGVSGQPGGAPTVRIRGISSLTHTSNDPLYVVDGIQVDAGGIDYLNPSDIESIEVLKDAASAAIYGTRAANGVILVTTKKGNAGRMSISYNGYFGVQNAAKKLKLLNATDYATLRNEAATNGGATTLPFPETTSLGQGTNWQDQIFNSARIQNHNLAFTGGSEKMTNYTSFGIYDQQGIVMKNISKYDRFSFRTNTTYKAKTWLTFGENLGYSYSKSKGVGNVNNEFGGPLSDAINLDPTTKVIETDPTILNSAPYSNHTVMTDANGNPYAISTQVGQEIYNPLAYEKAHLGNYSWAHNLVGNTFAEIKPIKGLTIRSSLGGKMAFYGSSAFTPIAYFNASTANAQTLYYQESNRGFSWSWENTAAYHLNANKHDFTALIGTGAYVDGVTTSNTVSYYGIPATTFADASLNFNIPNANKIAGGSEGVEHKISSLFARALYSYDEKYLFTGIIRRDGSSRFGGNHKYGYFPSASVGWVASKENFFPVNNTLTFLKFRGSYGLTGNDAIGDFRYAAIINGGRNYPTGNQYNIGYSPATLPNPDLKWEQSSQLDFGFDAFLFNNFNVTFDWFNKRTTGMLLPIPVPSYAGLESLPTGNVASMSNHGVELDLGYHAKIGQVNLDFKGNISYLSNKITDIGPSAFLDVPDSKLQSSTYLLERNQVGHPVDAFYGYQIDGVFQNQAEIDNYVDSKGNKIQPNAKPGDFKWADLNHDGKISSDSDRTFLGTPLPKWTFGLTISANWKGFDILIFGQGVAGNKIYNGLRRLDIPTANYSEAALGRWHGEGTSNDYPRLTTSDDNNNFSNPSSFMLSNGAYFRIKTLQIGYTLPRELISHAGFTKIRAFVSANNLVTITGYSGYDPEIGGLNYGIDKGIYPQARSFMVGLDLGF